VDHIVLVHLPKGVSDFDRKGKDTCDRQDAAAFRRHLVHQ
jgi:hypothetical protein